jgi:outer membrane protein TolC
VERDLDLEVRSRFAELLQARSEIEVRREGLERLRTYRTSLKSRQTAGQGIGADLLKTEVRLAMEETNLLEAERRLDEARLLLNELMGRDPTSPLSVVPLPPPEPRPGSPEDRWEGAPDVAAAEAEIRSAGAGLSFARSEQRPHLSLDADVGFWGSDTSRLVPLDGKSSKPGATFVDRVRRDAGYSLGLTFSWPLWDHGAARARVAQAELGLERARRSRDLQARGARVQWEQARSTLRSLARQIEVLTRSAPEARDAYLNAESRYRGGSATTLEVLDSYSAAVDASVRLTEATARYRIAQALETRWGTP